MLVTRFAPTPSGYLHLGNAVNAVLCDWLARSADGRLLLRIDDFDAGRVREAYLEDVFATLDWLGIHPEAGPSGPADFHAQWSMATRAAQFRSAIEHLLADHPDAVFVCRCSRRELGPGGRCHAGCAVAGHPLVPSASTLRLATDSGDHVLWRRDDLPGYDLGSVLCDEDLGVTALVRGEDLRASTAVQRHLATLLPAPGVLRAAVHHHALITALDGSKLSKSAGARSHPLERTAAQRALVHEWAEVLGAPLGITRP